MKWEYWKSMYLEKHCTARGLRPKTIFAYKASLDGFIRFIQTQCEDRHPDQVTANDILEYVEYLRDERNNGDAAVNRSVTIVRMFYRACVAMSLLSHDQNPMAHFPRMKAPKKRFRPTLDSEEVAKLINQPRKDTVIGIRDRTIIALLYGTGIRASECSGMTHADVDLANATIWVVGKGGHSRSVPLNKEVIDAMRQYLNVRGPVNRSKAFFSSRRGNAMSRQAIYERVRTHGRKSKIEKHVSPHTLRHTFATHLVRCGVRLPVLRDLLGHRQLASTEIYIHMTAQDIRQAISKHPIQGLMERVSLAPGIKLPFQLAPYRRSG